MNKTIVISIKDLFFYILNKWRSIVICMLIGGALLNCFGIYKSVKMFNAQNQVNMQNDGLNAKKMLNESDATFTENTFKIYKVYQQNYEQLSKYFDESVKMKLDANNVDTIVLQYKIDNRFETIYPVMSKRDTTEDIISCFQNKILSVATFDRIREELKVDIGNNYIEELISFSDSDDKSIKDKTLKVYIVGVDQKYCETIAKVIDEEINSQVDDLKKKFGDFDFSKINENYYRKVDMTLLSDQQTKMTSLSNAKNGITNLATNLSEGQMAYFSQLKAKNKDNVQAQEPEKNSSLSQSVVWVDKKEIVIGLLAGAFFCMLYWGAIYIFGDKLRMAEDIKTTYSLHVAGTVNGKETKSKLARLVSENRYGEISKYSKNERIEMTVSALSLLARKNNTDRLFLSSTIRDKNSIEVMEQIKAKMKDICKVDFKEKSMLYDAETLTNMSNYEAVILVEVVGKSKYKDIEQEIEICKRSDIPILGTVVIQE